MNQGKFCAECGAKKPPAAPLYRCDTLSKRYGAEIYLKREDLNHTGAHKINNAIGLALLAKCMGKRRIIAETGAGQHGVATATVCALLGMECTIFMGAVDIERQQPRDVPELLRSLARRSTTGVRIPTASILSEAPSVRLPIRRWWPISSR